MRTYRPRDHFEIWGLALGYFLFYIPYSALTKALSLGVLPGMDGPVPSFTLLPSTLVATSATMLAYLAANGAWRSLDRANLLGREVPTVAPATLGSGLATAVIIATTTLNYTSTGISILLALLVMRGGVLILSPFVDVIFGRRVHASSWIALALSFLAIGIAFSEVGGYRMTVPPAPRHAASTPRAL